MSDGQVASNIAHVEAMTTLGLAFQLLAGVEDHMRRLIANADFVMGAGAVLHPQVFIDLTSDKGENARHQVEMARAAVAFLDTVRPIIPRLPAAD